MTKYLTANDDLDQLKVNKHILDVVDYVDDMFKAAIDLWASDIHVEPTEYFILIRFRKDWDFFIIDKVDREFTSAIITRLKVLSRIKIDENKKPQDWKIIYYYEKEKLNIDIRLSTLPTKYGEKVVMRILKQDETLINLEALWLIDENLKKVKEELKSTYWIVLVAWPTGSWKSTTLFWVLKTFNPLEYNISTLEDPIEYNIDYVNQSQVRSDIGYTFASGLRSLVRQDPDIIMVWEIRDKETATLAVEAALTWHLVLSTIHTNSAAATIQRLINMGIEPFLLASAMKMVMSQRLWKRICPHCKWDAKLTEIQKTKVKEYLTPIDPSFDVEKFVFKEWKWCEVCNWTGYKWRIWFHEVMVVWEYLEPLILKKESAHAIQQEAIKHDMITIVQDALIKAVKWETTVEEAFKLI